MSTPADGLTALVRLDECPPGLFLFGETLCFRSEYCTTLHSGFNQPDAYVVESGEYFHGGTSNGPERSALMVRPVIATSVEALNDC